MEFPPFFDVSGLDITLDLRWMRGVAAGVDDAPALAERVEAALDEMEALEAGAIANPDEDRRVGHYWLRAPELAPDPALRDAIVAVRERSRDFAQDLGGRLSAVLVVGIGGSALGPQLVADALGGSHDRREVRFLDNTDPDGATRLLDGLELERTLVVVISKSGRTPETRNGYLRVKAAYEAAGLDFPTHAVAVTGEGSELDAQAANEGWMARFPMWDWVGGRTSVTSAVGLVPAQLQGLDVAGLLTGACQMDRVTRARSLADNPALALALMWYLEAERQGRRAMVVLPYKDRLVLLSKYLQQLVMESLGKRLDRQGKVVHQGLTVYGNKGSTDQHAYVQQLREGPADFFATFVEVLEDGPDVDVEPGVTTGDYLSGFLAGTRQALFEAGRRSITVTVPRVDPRRLGALIALFERAVGFYASMVDINAYHQPGVEAGKQAAARLLELQGKLLAKLAAGESGSASHLARVTGASEQDVFHLLRHLAANDRVAVKGRGLAMEFRARGE